MSYNQLTQNILALRGNTLDATYWSFGYDTMLKFCVIELESHLHVPSTVI
jgi:hypothetical protein